MDFEILIPFAAPVAYLSRLRSPGMKAMAFAAEQLELSYKITGKMNILPNSEVIALASMNACQEESIFQEVCLNYLFLLCGYNSELLNRTLLPIILKSSPTGMKSKIPLIYKYLQKIHVHSLQALRYFK